MTDGPPSSRVDHDTRELIVSSVYYTLRPFLLIDSTLFFIRLLFLKIALFAILSVKLEKAILLITKHFC